MDKQDSFSRIIGILYRTVWIVFWGFSLYWSVDHLYGERGFWVMQMVISSLALVEMHIEVNYRKK